MGKKHAKKTRNDNRLIAAAVFLITVICFIPAIHAQFVSWDDSVNFVGNPWYRGLGAEQLRWMWTTTLLGHYVPLAWMTLGLDYLLWGMDPRGYHLVNILLHAANAVLVFALVRRVLSMTARAADWRPNDLSLASALAALLFSVHPLRVESVAWVTERRDVLSLFFGLISVLSYLRSTTGDAPARRWYAISLACFAAALLSKATTVTLPAVLLILNVYPLRTIGGTAGWFGPAARRKYVELAPFAGLSMIAGVASVIVLRPGAQLTPGGKLAVIGYGIVFYLWKTIVPLRLSPLYQLPLKLNPRAPIFVACGALSAAFVAVLATVRRRWPGLIAAAAAYFVIMLPLLGVVQNGNQIVADRYTYHAAPALALIVGAVAIALLRSRRTLALGGGALVVCALGTLTWAQTTVWHDSARLWSRALELDSTNAIAHNDLGVELAAMGHPTDAIAQYEEAVALRPGYAQAHNNLGYEEERLGRVAEAEAEYREALHLDPEFTEAEINLGDVLLAEGRAEDAIAMYQRASTSNPNHAGAQYDWGIALMREGRLSEAADHLARATKLDPFDPDARDALRSVLERLGRL